MERIQFQGKIRFTTSREFFELNRLIDNLSKSVWVYKNNDLYKLVTQNYTSNIMLDQSTKDIRFIFDDIKSTTQFDITEALKTGFKIISTWEHVDSSEAISEGAKFVWHNIMTNSVKSTNKHPDLTPDLTNAEKLLPLQDDIDTLIKSMMILNRLPSINHNIIITDDKPNEILELELHKLDNNEDFIDDLTADLNNNKSTRHENDHQQIINASKQMNNNLVSAKRSAIDFESRLNNTPEEGQKKTSEIINKIFFKYPFNLIVSNKLNQIQNVLDYLNGDNNEKSVLAYWQNESIYKKIGQKTQEKYERINNNLKVSHEFTKNVLRSLQKFTNILPEYSEYETKKESIFTEINDLDQAMNSLYFGQIINTHEGKLIAAKIYYLEAKLERYSNEFARANYLSMRKNPPSLIKTVVFKSKRDRLIHLQSQLDAIFEKFAAIEDETRRHLEYQSNWQELLKKQTNKRRDLDDLEKASIYLSSIQTNTAKVDDILDQYKIRDNFLSIFCHLVEMQNIWLLRHNTEPFYVIGDDKVLDLPRISFDSHVIKIIDDNMRSNEMDIFPSQCASWAILSSTWDEVAAGIENQTNGNSLVELIETLARENGLSGNEAYELMGMTKQALIDDDNYNIKTN